MKNKFTTKDLDKLKKALKKAGAKPIKLSNATMGSSKKDKEEGTLIPECWAMKFYGYTLFEIKKFIDFGKSRNFIPEKTVFDRE